MSTGTKQFAGTGQPLKVPFTSGVLRSAGVNSVR